MKLLTIMKPRTTRAWALLLGTALALFSAHMAFGHVKIFPTESTYGIRERYMMRWPNEKNVKSIRVEGTFPPGINVYDFEYKPGYTIDFKKDDKGQDHRRHLDRRSQSEPIYRVRHVGYQSCQAQRWFELDLEFRRIL